MALLTKQQFDGVLNDSVRTMCFTKIYDLSMDAADAIDENRSINRHISSMKSLVNDLIRIPSGYNQPQVSSECGQHIIDDIESCDSALIRSKWVMVPGTTVKSPTFGEYACRLLKRLTRSIRQTCTATGDTTRL